MKLEKSIFLLFILLLNTLNGMAQITEKPVGCYAGTNGTHPLAMEHSESRGVLISQRWSEIELSPGVFDFTPVNAKIDLIKDAGLKYSLAILGGTVGSPEWLIDELSAPYVDHTFHGEPLKLPLWWDSIVQARLDIMILELGDQYAHDTALSHVYVTQMSANGVEGHLNGLDIGAFEDAGFTAEKWINSALVTIDQFASAFPDKALAFEVHEIDGSVYVPSTIMDSVFANEDYCERIGLATWWLSGKETYQPDLLDYIENFEGDKYGQVIGRSDQIERFRDELYSTVFDQAKVLGLRYVEPWPFEFQYHTHDELLADFNTWADLNFTTTDTCHTLSIAEHNEFNELSVYPNPIKNTVYLNLNDSNNTIQMVSVLNLAGKVVLITEGDGKEVQLEMSNLASGFYCLVVQLNTGESLKIKVIRE